MKSGIVRHGRLPLCVLAVVSQSEISAVCVRVSFQHHGHYPLAVSYLFPFNLVLLSVSQAETKKPVL